jgi:threonine dehydrogenase-like Zn-dependent dehydrogenase
MVVLQLVKDHGVATDTINFSEQNVVEAMQGLIRYGPDICIDATGFDCAQNVMHKVMRFVRLETDTCEVINQVRILGHC